MNFKSISAARVKKTPQDLEADAATGPGLPYNYEQSPVLLSTEDGAPIDPSRLDTSLGTFAPNASAGSYKKVFVAMGCTRIEDWITSSSAGDWTFVVKRGGSWHMASQECKISGGFSYCIEEDEIQSSEAWICEDGLAQWLLEIDPDYAENLADEN